MKNLSDAGPKPEIKWLPVDCFVVDHHYQRHTNSKASQKVIADIAHKFRWSMFQPPTVTPGPGDKYTVIDGQHRIEAVARRSDIEKIPVYIIPEMTREECARNFVSINKNRVALNPLALYRASIAMGDPMALRIKDCCEEAEVTVAKHAAPFGMTSPRELACVGTLKTGLKKYTDDVVIAALMVIPDAYPEEKGMMRSSALKALMAFFHERTVKAVNREILIEVLLENDPASPEGSAFGMSKTQEMPTAVVMQRIIEAEYDRLSKAEKRRLK